MKTPPMLLGAALLFWGWQTGLLVVGAVMGIALEVARWVKARWEFSDEDFRRIWTFCALLLLATAVFAFTSNDGPNDIANFFQNPNFLTQRTAGAATSKAAAAWLRWLPIVFFLFVAAQIYSSREGIPLEVISLILRRRWKRARELGLPAPPSKVVNVSYPYFCVCLFAASIHYGENSSFFWGFCILLTWALWPQRARRFAPLVWVGALGLALLLGYSGQRGVGLLQRYLDNLNPQWLGRFTRRGFDPTQSKTSIGQIGRLKASGKIVIRMVSKDGPPPRLLREASYRAYKAQTWYSEVRESDYTRVVETPINSGNWPLLPDKTNTACASIACYLENKKALLPLPETSGRLENLQAFQLSRSDLGAVLAEGPGLVVFDAHYGPGASMDSDANTNEDLSLPPKEIPALDRVISEAGVANIPPAQALQTLQEFFLEKFNYSIWQGPGSVAGTNETPLSRFLLLTRSGHCEYFATATTLVLRRLHIPARYAVGYSVHEGSGKRYVVRMRDAHAWCLAWNEQTRTWQDVDTTPATWVEAEGNQASKLQFLSDLWSRVAFEFSRFRWGQTHLRLYLLWSLIPILALLLYQIVFRSRRKRHAREKLSSQSVLTWPGFDSEFYQLEKQLAEVGTPRRNGEALSNWLSQAANKPGFDELRSPLRRLLLLHYRYRFDPNGLSEQEREALRQEARACLAKLKSRNVATV